MEWLLRPLLDQGRVTARFGLDVMYDLHLRLNSAHLPVIGQPALTIGDLSVFLSNSCILPTGIVLAGTLRCNRAQLRLVLPGAGLAALIEAT